MSDLFSYPHSPGVKSPHRDTSVAAADAIQSRAAILRQRVADLFRTGRYTADECADALGETVLSIRPRCSELAKQGAIVDSGLRRRNASGKMAIVWRAA